MRRRHYRRNPYRRNPYRGNPYRRNPLKAWVAAITGVKETTTILSLSSYEALNKAALHFSVNFNREEVEQGTGGRGEPILTVPVEQGFLQVWAKNPKQSRLRRRRNSYRRNPYRSRRLRRRNPYYHNPSEADDMRLVGSSIKNMTTCDKSDYGLARFYYRNPSEEDDMRLVGGSIKNMTPCDKSDYGLARFYYRNPQNRYYF